MYQAKKIIKPPYLKAGDKVALVSPAYWMPEEAILQAAEIIRSWGLHPVIGPHTTSLEVDAYSGTADERAADMLWALEDDSIKAIVCTRGGYGSIHCACNWISNASRASSSGRSIPTSFFVIFVCRRCL
jgi:muramoyltetrapeptide carboxypeptidase